MAISTNQLNELKRRFLDRCRDNLVALKSAAQDARATEPGEQREALVRIAHSLAGTGGIFGFAILSDKASHLETFLLSGQIDRSSFDTLLQNLVSELEAMPGG